MNQEMYSFIDYDEAKHWWFVARANILKALVEEYDDEIENFLDIGCGTGYFLNQVSPIVENCYGIDIAEYKNPKFPNIIKGSAEQLPFDNNTFDFVSCLDVLEHLKNPQEALDGILRVLKPGGFAIITVPACQFLYGPHDKENDHVRRFSKKSFNAMVNPRFEIMRSTYFNTFLFPMECVARIIEKIINFRITKLETPNSKTNNILFKIFNSEKKILLKHDLPIGMSYLAVLRKRR